VLADARWAGALDRFCKGIEQEIGVAIEAKVYTSYRELLEAARAGRADIVWASPLIAIDLEDAGVAAPSVVVARSSRAGYYSALFTRTASELRRPEDLRAARAAWVSPESASGYFVPRWHLRSTGVDLARAFGEEKFYGTHKAVTRAVLDGEADVGATHVGLDPLTGKLASAPWLPDASARVLLLVGPIPGDVFAISQRVDAGTKRRLVAAFVAMRGDADSRLLFETGRFDPVPDGHLDLLRRLLRFRETRG
jgi:phosphonate transport system substrate-binding protein